MQEGIAQQPDRLKQYAGIIKNENDRLKRQVDKVLQIATLEKGEVALRNETLDMHKIISSALETLQVMAQEKDGSIELDLEADRFEIQGDRVHLTNVIYNLLDNAIKYSKRPEVSLSTENSPKHFILYVKDNGLGLAREDRERVFDKFYRVSQGNVHDIKGFGLGLFYVKRILEAHRGKVSVTSELGQGSMFKVELPFNQ